MTQNITDDSMSRIIEKIIYYKNEAWIFPGYNKHAKLERYNKQRDELIKNGSISKINDKYILNVTLDFNTPSGVSDFVLGGSTNGWTEWKNKDRKTLDELYRK